ncbi:MAG: choline kinase [Denitrovibrio sp.]|nr:MAG: choline kinase [Denitrovibrio sp.]
MNQEFIKTIKHATGADDIRLLEVIQELWSGYGSIKRYELRGSSRKRVVVKHISFEKDTNHPRGWNTNISHQRKLKSYQVEQEWYQKWTEPCNDSCKIPECLAIKTLNGETLIVLEDLDESGYTERLNDVSETELCACLAWLANFHAVFMGRSPNGLWEQGTYWHLETRPDELKVLTDIDLKNVAGAIDNILKNSRFQTIVHGDAKLANFCFTPSGSKVAAVDFQYVGGGCGMKDVAYFISSCLDEEEQERDASWVLDYYFSELGKALERYHPTLDIMEIEKDWRTLYPVAIADFHRFLKGWSPGHWKQNTYTEKITREVINLLSD